MVCGVHEAPREVDKALRETARAFGHVSNSVAAAAASPALSPVPPDLLTCRSFAVFETLDKGFVHVVVPQLGGPVRDCRVALACTQQSVSSFLDAHGHYDRAIELFKRALRIQMATLEEMQAGTISSMGTSYSRKGQHDRAIEFHERALRICHAMLGPHHL